MYMQNSITYILQSYVQFLFFSRCNTPTSTHRYSQRQLQVIQSDFARLQAETESAEEAAKKEYNEFMEDSKVLLFAGNRLFISWVCRSWWVGVVNCVAHDGYGHFVIQVDKATKSKTAEHKTGKKKTKIQEWKTWKTLTG